MAHVKYTYVSDTTEPTSVSQARTAFDRAHGKASGLLVNAQSGNPTNMEQMQQGFDSAVSAYDALPLNEKQAVARQLVELVDIAGQWGIKSAVKPRVAAPAQPQSADDNPAPSI